MKLVGDGEGSCGVYHFTHGMFYTTSCVMLSKSRNFSVPQAPRLYSRDYHHVHLIGLLMTIQHDLVQP